LPHAQEGDENIRAEPIRQLADTGPESIFIYLLKKEKRMLLFCTGEIPSERFSNYFERDLQNTLVWQVDYQVHDSHNH
jgi:hypothetical protein